jgi:hypothetical protein
MSTRMSSGPIVTRDRGEVRTIIPLTFGFGYASSGHSRGCIGLQADMTLTAFRKRCLPTSASRRAPCGDNRRVGHVRATDGVNRPRSSTRDIDGAGRSRRNKTMSTELPLVYLARHGETNHPARIQGCIGCADRLREPPSGPGSRGGYRHRLAGICPSVQLTLRGRYHNLSRSARRPTVTLFRGTHFGGGAR